MWRAGLFCLSILLGTNSFAQVPDWKRFETPTPQNQPTQATPTQTPTIETKTIDESQELIDIEAVLAASIMSLGPLEAYSQFISEIGTLVDAGGVSKEGVLGVNSRFEKFPKGIILERLPENALASGGAGSSWGAYQVKKGLSVLSSGRYVAVWRKEYGKWKIVTEMAAGKDSPPPPLPTKPEKAPKPKQDDKKPPIINPKILYDALGRPIKP